MTKDGPFPTNNPQPIFLLNHKPIMFTVNNNQSSNTDNEFMNGCFKEIENTLVVFQV